MELSQPEIYYMITDLKTFFDTLLSRNSALISAIGVLLEYQFHECNNSLASVGTQDGWVVNRTLPMCGWMGL